MLVIIRTQSAAFKKTKLVPEVIWAGIGSGFVQGCVVSSATLSYDGGVRHLPSAAPIKLSAIAGTHPTQYGFSADLIFSKASDGVVDSDQAGDKSRPADGFVGAYISITITNDGPPQPIPRLSVTTQSFAPASDCK